jgi:predicted enzyme related to lactoylglutathione lyase
MNRVMHFEIQADNVERATKFYTQVFGWKIDKWEGGQMDYWFVVTGEKGTEGINGGLLQRQAPAPDSKDNFNAFVCTIVVDNYDEIAKKIVENGGTETMGKYPLKGMAWQGYYVDTEGNTFGLHQPDENAA